MNSRRNGVIQTPMVKEWKNEYHGRNVSNSKAKEKMYEGVLDRRMGGLESARRVWLLAAAKAA